MNRQSLDIWDEFPPEMKLYCKNYGLHFQEKSLRYALGYMKRKNPATGKMEKIEPWTKEQVDELLKKHNITLENNELHDYVYVANMAKADFFKSCLPTEKEVALYIRDVIDDPDAVDGMVFNRWISDMMLQGHPIDWASIL